uniref:Peptidase S1 domain-containing protein n=1 Tax=Megaselia scalaris TaxID=36166 RepID=T1H3I0_MEGSC
MDIAGWGKTEQASSSSRKMKAMVKGFDLTECSQTYRNIGIILSDSQICAGGAIGFQFFLTSDSTINIRSHDNQPISVPCFLDQTQKNKAHLLF